MKKRFQKVYDFVIDFTQHVTKNHMAAYAAMSAFFFVLSLIPIILLLLTIVRFTPVTKADTMTAVMTIFPSSFTSLITSIVNQVYNQSMTIIPITIIVALWSAGKGVLAINSGLNVIYKCPETRNYFYLRIRATIYTVLFIVVIISLLVLSVFGDRLNIWINAKVPFYSSVSEWLIGWRVIFTPLITFVFLTLIYKYLPNRKSRLKREYAGAIFSIICWMIISYIFSVYLEVFTGFSTMYGSMTTIVLIMMWLYFGMYSILLGAQVNRYVDKAKNNWKEKKRKNKEEKANKK